MQHLAVGGDGAQLDGPQPKAGQKAHGRAPLGIGDANQKAADLVVLNKGGHYVAGRLHSDKRDQVGRRQPASLGALVVHRIAKHLGHVLDAQAAAGAAGLAPVKLHQLLEKSAAAGGGRLAG